MEMVGRASTGMGISSKSEKRFHNVPGRTDST